MIFTKRLREGVRRGRIRCSVRIWTRPHVKAGGRYRMEEGHIVVDSIVPIRLAQITNDLARESGFSSAKDLLQTAKHGRGSNVYLVRFRYLPPGASDVQRAGQGERNEGTTEQLLRRIRVSSPPLKQKPFARQLQRVRKICLGLPGATEKLSHGEPTFFVKNGVFAMFSNNHHHDGHVAVLLPAAPGLQEALVEEAPDVYYRPPYVGSSGWVGVELDQVDDEVLAAHVRAAWQIITDKKKTRDRSLRRPPRPRS